MSSRDDTPEPTHQLRFTELGPPGGSSSRRCGANRADGSACQAWAVRDSDPPRCAAHSGRVGAPKGNRNAVRHGAYGRLEIEISGISDAVQDLERRLSMLASYLERVEDPEAMMSALGLYGQMVSRYGRLLRDKKALSGEAADSVLENLAIAAENLGAQLGWSIFDE